MENKHPYENAKIELLLLNPKDIIVTSGEWDGPLNNGSGESSNDAFGWT